MSAVQIPTFMKSAGGFTLIELLVVIIIIGILTSISYPIFRGSVVQTHRADGKDAILRAAALQERWYTENNEYTGTIGDIGGVNSREGYYTIAVAVGDITGTTCNTGTHAQDNCYVLTATPTSVGGQDQDGDCASFVLNSFGQKTVSGTLSAADCW
jgi:type IV pilus assembly protein PilE